jgi:hypothetical protein
LLKFPTFLQSLQELLCIYAQSYNGYYPATVFG